jgi:hypothetical protein
MGKASKRLLICVDSTRYGVSLERRKIYVELPDARAEKLKYVRIDESGKDHLCSSEYLVPLLLRQPIRKSGTPGHLTTASPAQS